VFFEKINYLRLAFPRNVRFLESGLEWCVMTVTTSDFEPRRAGQDEMGLICGGM
jgi:hypothetical protein